jgi:hypothetical protein
LHQHRLCFRRRVLWLNVDSAANSYAISTTNGDTNTSDADNAISPTDSDTNSDTCS